MKTSAIQYHFSLTHWLVSLLLIALMLVFVACDDQTTEDLTVEYEYDYFPVEIGRSWTYQVDSITFDPSVGGTAIDSFRTFLREVVVDTLRDNTGQLQYAVEQYSRRHDSLPWKIDKVLVLALEERKAIRLEDNLRFVKMPFPVNTGDSWEGSAFFDPFLLIEIRGEQVQMFKEWSYRVLEKGQPVELGDLSFEEVASLQNADAENLFERRYALEQYAKGVGLIYRELLIADTQCQACCAGDADICEALPWREKAEKGMILRQQLISYQ